jgi:hypothetical protein
MEEKVSRTAELVTEKAVVRVHIPVRSSEEWSEYRKNVSAEMRRVSAGISGSIERVTADDES